jgi:hypothetical protein
MSGGPPGPTLMPVTTSDLLQTAALRGALATMLAAAARAGHHLRWRRKW